VKVQRQGLSLPLSPTFSQRWQHLEIKKNSSGPEEVEEIVQS